MRIHEQRRELLAGVGEVESMIDALRKSVLRKMARPYPDGSRSDLVNASSDVLPQLRDILQRLDLLARTINA